jgi:fatty acid amide hydrolase 2
MNTLWQQPAHRLATMVRKREVSSLELTRALISRIEAVNPRINALVVPCFEQALQQARNWDAAPRQAPLGGVPFSIKEIIEIAGMPCTMGSVHRRHYIAHQTATVVKRMLKAGGVLLGLTNLPERSFWSESYNPIYGRTSNPYDPERIPGGSSGGEAALVAAGGSPLGLGSDIGGSIRLPAFFCGIYGHKPSAGLIPMTGHYPFDQLDKLPRPIRGAPLYMGIGPLARSAADLSLAMEVLAGPDGLDPTCDLNLPPAADVDWRGRTIYIMPRPRMQHCTPVQAEVAQQVTRAAKVFEAAGAVIEELPDDLFWRCLDLWSAVLAEGGVRMVRELGDGSKPIPLLLESLKLLGGRSQHTPPALLFAWIDQLQGLSPRRLRQALSEAERLRQLIDRRLQGQNLLLMPPQPKVAPFHDEMLRRPMDFGYTAMINVLQLPATAIPTGLNAQGLPLGIQAIASHGSDRLTLQAASFLEAALGGWTAPRL